MKKQLITLAVCIIISSGVFGQSTIWKSYGSGLDSTWGIRYLSVVNIDTVWAIGYHGSSSTATNKFTRTINGANFTVGTFLPDTNTFNASSICGVNAHTAFISAYDKASDGTNGQILKTADGGNTWSNIANDSMFVGANNFPDFVYFWDTNKGIAVGDPNRNTTYTTTTKMFEIWQTTDGGTTWARTADSLNPVPLTNEYGVSNSYAVYGQKVWFGTTSGRVYSSSDSGKWVSYPTGLYGGANGLAFRDSLHGIVWGFVNSTTQHITVLNTVNGGRTWTFLAPNASIGTTDFSTIPGTYGYVSVGLNGASSAYATSVTHSDGVSWNVLESNSSNIEKITTIHMVDTLNGWAGSYTTNGTMNGMNKYIGPNVTDIKSAKNTTNYLNIYPNPNSGMFTIDVESLQETTEIEITDMLGKEVYKTNLKGNSAKQNLPISLSDIQKGMYLLKMQSGDISQIQKLIIQ